MKVGELFLPFTDEMHWDVIISNPPYISEKEFNSLPPEVRNWDPPEALLGGKDGTEFPVNLIYQSYKRLNSPGYLILEIGAGQSYHIMQEIQHLNWSTTSIEKDFSGFERFIVFEK
jgi:release factor glutamine methyltransferase